MMIGPFLSALLATFFPAPEGTQAATPTETPEMIEARANNPRVKTPPKFLSGAEVEETVPEEARAIGAHGTVVIKGIIDRNGNLIQAWVATSSKSALLDETALSGAQKAKFEPAKDAGGNPIATLASLPFTFENIYTPGPGGGILRYRCDQFVRDQNWWRATWPAERRDQTYLMAIGVGLMAEGLNLEAARRLNRDFPKRWDAAIEACRKKPDALFVDMLKPEGKAMRAIAERTP